MPQYSFNWKQLSVTAGIMYWQFYFRLFPGPIKGSQIIEFLKALRRQIGRKLPIVRDGLGVHKSRLVRNYLESLDSEIAAEYLPAYAAELNPSEYIWGYLKERELANLRVKTFAELSPIARNRPARHAAPTQAHRSVLEAGGVAPVTLLGIYASLNKSGRQRTGLRRRCAPSRSHPQRDCRRSGARAPIARWSCSPSSNVRGRRPPWLPLRSGPQQSAGDPPPPSGGPYSAQRPARRRWRPTTWLARQGYAKLLWLALALLAPPTAADIAERYPQVKGFFPQADRYGDLEGDPPAAAVYQGEEVIGYAFLTADGVIVESGV